MSTRRQHFSIPSFGFSCNLVAGSSVVHWSGMCMSKHQMSCVPLFTLPKLLHTQLQYFCLENPMDGGAWWAADYGVAQSRTQLRDFTFTFHFHALEKEMANHSSVLAWRIPGTGEPGGLPSMGSHRVGHD